MNTFCHYFNQRICSSCQEIQTPYQEQIKAKEQKLMEQLSPLQPFQLLPTITSRETGFRNKAKLSVTGSLENPVLGLVGEDDLDLGRDIKDCPLHHPKINEVIHGIPSFMKATDLKPYQIASRTGELKGLIIYYSSESQELYLRFILRSKESLDRLKKKSQTLIQTFPFIKSLSANIQPIPHAVLEGEEEVILSGPGFILHQLGEVHMTLSPKGFVQTNQEMAKKLYETATLWAKEKNPAKFLELFSGQGAFSFFIQNEVQKALGVEIDPEAVRQANQTAQKSNFNHLQFLAKDAASVEKEVKDFKADLILVNPPRKGLGKGIEILKNYPSPWLIYSSCSLASLRKDLKELSISYNIEKIQIFDMFPHTNHFETLVLLKFNGA